MNLVIGKVGKWRNYVELVGRNQFSEAENERSSLYSIISHSAVNGGKYVPYNTQQE